MKRTYISVMITFSVIISREGLVAPNDAIVTRPTASISRLSWAKFILVASRTDEGKRDINGQYNRTKANLNRSFTVDANGASRSPDVNSSKRYVI